MMGTHVRVTFENACTAVMPTAVLAHGRVNK